MSGQCSRLRGLRPRVCFASDPRPQQPRSPQSPPTRPRPRPRSSSASRPQRILQQISTEISAVRSDPDHTIDPRLDEIRQAKYKLKARMGEAGGSRFRYCGLVSVRRRSARFSTTAALAGARRIAPCCLHLAPRTGPSLLICLLSKVLAPPRASLDLGRFGLSFRQTFALSCVRIQHARTRVAAAPTSPRPTVLP
jgi:hypothetical protein